MGSFYIEEGNLPVDVRTNSQNDDFEDMDESEIYNRVDIFVITGVPIVACVVSGEVVGEENAEHEDHEHES